MRILLASSEVHPYSKTGGLGDMVGSLGKALSQAGHRVGIVTPFYESIAGNFPACHRLDWFMELPLGGARLRAEVWTLEPRPNLTVYLIRQPEFYARRELYQEHGQVYSDNAERFIFFSKAVAHLARYLPWKPEVVHLHDWQTGLVPALVRHQRGREGWGDAPRTVFTIHNLAYQGQFRREAFELANLPAEYFSPAGCEFYGGFNCMKSGICFADIITTVSPRYAREIGTEAFGCGLDGFLRERQDRLIGILNGVDYEEWTTTGDPHLVKPYSLERMAGKAANKTALQKELGLPADPRTPLFGNISRLVEQKGTELLLGSLEEMLSCRMQFVFLGNGEPYLEDAIARMARRFPEQVAARIGFDTPLAHRIEAGCDFYVMPSRFEPCGLNQMYSLRYGTIPVVRRTGGLDDSIIDYLDNEALANGIKFNEYSTRALSQAFRKALTLIQYPKLRRTFQRNGMKADLSWERTAKIYAELYAKGVEGILGLGSRPQ